MSSKFARLSVRSVFYHFIFAISLLCARKNPNDTNLVLGTGNRHGHCLFCVGVKLNMYPFSLTYLRAFSASFFPFSLLVRLLTFRPSAFSRSPFAAVTSEANKRLRIEICKPNTFLVLSNFPLARSLAPDPFVRWPHKCFSTFHSPVRITTNSPTRTHSQQHALSSSAFKLPLLP